MKKTLLSFIIAAASVSSFASLVLNEPFSYEDGALITVSSGAWTNHSGTAGQTDVLAGKVNVTQSNSEDVNALLSGAPHASGSLYAGFIINFSALPSASGGYFAHFKDDGTFNFKARLFARTTGAAEGQFRLGISNGGSTVAAVEKDLSLGVDYFVVVRYDTENGIATLWINPGSESATGDRAEGSDSTAVVPIYSFALRQATGIGSLTLDDLKVGTSFADVSSGGDPGANPPVISNIVDQKVPANTPTASVPFTVNDGETSAANLVLTKASANQTLIPEQNIVFGGTGTDRTVTITPGAGQQGTTTITVTVTDADMNSASREFLITVGAPSISPIANQATPVNSSSSPVTFNVSDTESAAGSLVVTAISSDEAIVSNTGITWGGSGGDRTVVLTPVPDAAGLVTITLTVSDGINEVSTDFKLTIHPQLGLDFEDDFTYGDGSIITNSGFIWNTHSASTGQTGQTQVVEGRLLLSGTQTEDINRFFVNSPYETNSGVILYSKFTVNFSSLPSADAYFAHFRDTSGGFRARVFATTSGAASGSFRLGLSNGGNTFEIYPTDLNLDTTYTVVTRYNVGTAESAMWINPFSESSSHIVGTDFTFPQWIWTYAFRQATGIGSLAIDDLKIGTAFSDVFDVIAEPPALSVTQSGSSIEISWPADSENYVLESLTDLTSGVWAPVSETPVVSGDKNVVTIPNTGTGSRFFRLRQ